MGDLDAPLLEGFSQNLDHVSVHVSSVISVGRDWALYSEQCVELG